LIASARIIDLAQPAADRDAYPAAFTEISQEKNGVDQKAGDGGYRGRPRRQ
jgi:hypothetical protein